MNLADNKDSSPFQLTPIQQKDWSAARILHENDIAACLVGSPVSAFYGSDDLWVWVPIIVQDQSFNTACDVLNANGYENVTLGPDEYQSFQPPEHNADGTEAVRWRPFTSPNQSGTRAILAPASHWHFEIKEDTTIVVKEIRVPILASYLQALASLLAHRCKASIPAGYFQLQSLSIYVLLDKYPNELRKLPLVDKFFLERYSSLRRSSNRKKVAELWECLKRGVITIDEALAAAPIERRPERARQRKGEDGKSVEPTPAA